MSSTGARVRAVLAVSTASCTALALSAAAVLFYGYEHVNHKIKTFSSVGIATSRPPAATPAAPGAQAPLNILLIGSDSRSGDNESLGGGTGVDGARSDTTILLHISGDRQHATGVSIPRDSIVDIPACEANGQWYQPQYGAMFNSAFATGDLPGGNPICTQNTVEAMTGIRIDHTIVMDFDGFAQMATDIGGVNVCVPPVDNTQLEQAYGVSLSPGMQTLSGQDALEYVRAREGFGDNSDIGRMLRQQAFLSALLKKLAGTNFYGDPIELYDLAEDAAGSITVDQSLDSVGAMVLLALQFKDIPVSNIEFVTAPWQYDGARVDLVQPDTDILWQLLRDDDTLEGQNVSGATASAGATSGASPTVSGDDAPSVTPSGEPLAPQDSIAATEAATSPSATTSTSTESASPNPSDPYNPNGGDGSGDYGEYGASPGASMSISSIPSSITQNIRPADSDACSDITYGS
ncbi:MAG TPA: LCP family protein [Actinocrinis sp.]